jgi:hypothetical protein
VHAAGVFRTPASLAKEERLCRATELWWGQTVPNGERVIERANALLTMSDEEVAPIVDWRVAAQRVAEADRKARGE